MHYNPETEGTHKIAFLGVLSGSTVVYSVKESLISATCKLVSVYPGSAPAANHYFRLRRVVSQQVGTEMHSCTLSVHIFDLHDEEGYFKQILSWWVYSK